MRTMNNLFCEFTPMSNNKLLVCKDCGTVIQLRDKNKKFMCKSKIEELSAQKNSGVKFVRTESVPYPSGYSSQTNNTNEQKQCSQKQIDNRLEVCRDCDFYQNNTCLKCGCSLSRDRVFMNKLYWADQSCPIGKWGPVEPEVSTE